MSIFGNNYPAIDLDGSVVVISGGGRGIGRATAQLFASQGAHVCVGDIDEDTAVDTAATIGGRGYVLDVTSRASWDTFTAKVIEEFGYIDILVNNAGVMPIGAFLDESDAVSRVTLDVNIWGPIHGMRSVLPGMVDRRRGHIVNVASMAGKLPVPGMAVYNASKFGAVGLSASARVEFADTGVSVSAILPSAVRTGLSSGVPLGKGMPTVEPEVVAQAVVDSVDHRRAETAVPRYLAGWDVIDALVPEWVINIGRRVIDDRRALTSVDPVGRSDYEQRVARQAENGKREKP